MKRKRVHVGDYVIYVGSNNAFRGDICIVIDHCYHDLRIMTCERVKDGQLHNFDKNDLIRCKSPFMPECKRDVEKGDLCLIIKDINSIYDYYLGIFDHSYRDEKGRRVFVFCDKKRKKKKYKCCASRFHIVRKAKYIIPRIPDKLQYTWYTLGTVDGLSDIWLVVRTIKTKDNENFVMFFSEIYYTAHEANDAMINYFVKYQGFDQKELQIMSMKQFCEFLDKERAL